MQNLLGFLLLSLFLNTTAITQTNFSVNEKAVQQTIIDMFECLSARDSIKLKSFCTSDIKLIEYGQIWTLDTLIHKAIIQNQYPDFKRINTFKFINTKTNKNVAWVNYFNQAYISSNGSTRKINWIETVVLVKENKRWKINLLHSTRM